MKKLNVCGCIIALLAFAVPCFAAGSAWDGSWKLNQSKSKMTGDTFTITDKGAGGYHLSTGSTIQYDFACNGKPYPVIADRTTACTGNPASGFDFTTQGSGKVLSKSHRTLSSDGQTMTIKGQSMHPDGTSSEFEDVYKRVSSGKGLVGKWMNTQSKMSTSDVMVLRQRGDVVHLEFPTYKEMVDAKLDGSDSKVTGPTIPAGASMTLKSEGANKLHYVDKYNGKVLNEGTMSVSSDGRVLTEEEWEPGKLNEKETLVYEKQ